MELTDEQIEEAGIEIGKIAICDSQGWEAWQSLYSEWGVYPHAPHKAFEHYASSILLSWRPQGTHIDIAADQSPFNAAVEYMGLCWNNYSQDLSYDAGWYDRCIGSPASAMPIPDSFADTMTLHCSFEHFEGWEDMKFLDECQRVLRPGGECVILPFYTWHEYTETPPQPSPNTGFGRFYDVEAISVRIVQHLGNLRAIVYNVFLEDEYRFRALVLTK